MQVCLSSSVAQQDWQTWEASVGQETCSSSSIWSRSHLHSRLHLCSYLGTWMHIWEALMSILTTGAKSGHSPPDHFSLRDMLAKEQSKLWNIAMHWLLSQWHLGVMQFMAESYSRRLDGSWRTEAPNRKARSLPGNGLPPHPNLEPKNEPKWIKGCAWFGGHNLESLRLAVSLHVSSVMMGYTGCHSQYRVCQLLMDKRTDLESCPIYHFI